MTKPTFTDEFKQGVVQYVLDHPNESKVAVAKKFGIDINYLLIETDSPYLPPHPYRGKRNESFYVVEVAKTIAELRNMSLDDLSVILEDNYRRLVD